MIFEHYKRDGNYRIIVYNVIESRSNVFKRSMIDGFKPLADYRQTLSVVKTFVWKSVFFL